MDSLIDIVELSLPTISNAPELIEVWAKMWAGKSDFNKNEIGRALREAVALEKGDMSILKEPIVKIDLSKNIDKLDGSKWGLNRREYRIKMNMVTKMRSIVMSANIIGISKTNVFKKMRKDNGHWRATLTEWLNELVNEGHIQYAENRYYSNNLRVETREQMIHRLVFESLEIKPLSMTAIAKSLGYDGGDARAYIKYALEELSCKGYICKDGIRWRWKR